MNIEINYDDLKEFNQLYINKSKRLKRGYAFINEERSNTKKLILSIDDSYEKLNPTDEYYSLYESSCHYPEKDMSTMNIVKDLIISIEEKKNAIRRKNLALDLYKVNIENRDIKVDNFNNILKQLDEIIKNIDLNILELKQENLKLVNELIK